MVYLSIGNICGAPTPPGGEPVWLDREFLWQPLEDLPIPPSLLSHGRLRGEWQGSHQWRV